MNTDPWTANDEEPTMMRMLVSVKNVDEARLAAAGGADFIDLKDPAQGALGGLPPTAIIEIVAALHAGGSRLPISATIGDRPGEPIDEIIAAVLRVGACGVDYVKVGVESAAQAGDLLRALAGLGGRRGQTEPGGSSWSVVPVFIADAGIDVDAVALACRLRTESRGACFPALMLDTQDKLGGSLLDAVGQPALRRFVKTVRAAGALVGLAGALRPADLAGLAEIDPDFAGFRSAVCSSDRAGALDPQRLRSLRLRFHPAPALNG